MDGLSTKPIPERPPPANRNRRCAVLTLEFIVPLLLFFLISNYLLGADRAVEWIVAHRPGQGTVPAAVSVESEMIHVEADRRQNRGRPKIVFCGSSSVLNGVDARRVAALWRKQGLNAMPVNYGMTGFTAYELPLMKRWLLAPDVRGVVFLYNMFSFPDVMHPQAGAVRFDAEEVLSGPLRGRMPRRLIVKGIWGQVFFTVKYRRILRETARRAAAGSLVRKTHPFGYDPGFREPTRPKADRVPPGWEWLRLAFLTSGRGTETLGTRGLARFIELADEAGVTVVVGPVPTPRFALADAWRRGVSQEAVDGLAAAVCRRHDAAYLDRAPYRFIEEQPGLFRDHAHLRDRGRDIFSDLVARRLRLWFED